jgi:hypothetical protein
MSDARILVGDHLRATADGRIVLWLSGSGPATVTVRPARPITPRWSGSARSRSVRLGMREVDLRPDAATPVTVQLSRDHLALLRRMQRMRITIRLQTHDRVVTRRIDLHPPAGKPRPRRRAGMREPRVSRRPRRPAGRTDALRTSRPLSGS